MKVSRVSTLAACVSAVTARFIETHEVDSVELYPSEEKFLIELAPGETRWVTEDEKWELRRVSPRILSLS